MQSLRDSLLVMQSSILWRDDAANPIVTEDIFSSAERLQFYRNNVVIGLTDALAAVFPVVLKLVGEDFFRVACREYIPQFPPRQAQVQVYGDKFADFLRDFPAASSLPYLADVAELEWARHLAYTAANTEKLAPGVLAEIPVTNHANLCLRLTPAVQLIKSEYPVLQIWTSNQETYSGDAVVNLDDGEEYVIITRPGFEVFADAISAGEWTFLNALQKNESIDVALKAALQADPAFDLAMVLGRRVEDGTIKDFYIKG